MSLGVEQPTFSREVEAGDCGIKWIDFSDRFQDERLREAASVNIVVGGVPEFSERQDIFFNAIAMPYTQGYRRRYSVTYYRQRANNDLQDPYGTVYLDRGLLERRLTKNGWSLDDLMRNRRTWLRQNLINAQTEMLDHISRSEGWNPAKAIWTSGYVHKAEKFLAETDILCRAFSAEGIDEIPFIKEGRQLIIHLVDNKEWHSTRSTYHLADLIVDIAKRGITVINSDGENLTKTFRKKVPITVILHNNIKNKELKTLTSEMSGTAKRDANDEFWIDFPAFVTGSASWLETVSSGSIWLHDDVDTFPGLKEEILLSILIRMLALEDVNGEHSWQGLKAEAEARVGEFLMGTENNIDKYAHLEEWTLQARRYTEMMFRFNMVDDILAYIIETHKAEEGGKDSEAPASHKGPRKGYRYEREIQSAA